MFQLLSKTLERPPLYTPSEEAFWDDEHISKQMLAAHLDPEFEGASRKLSTIELSSTWIQNLVSPALYPNLLDIGCGPGLYAERFAKAGYQVTGIDFSKRSIQYAQNSCLEQSLDITYLYQNYLTMGMGRTFDIATMIYCDYGALSTANRRLLLQKVAEHLRVGGKFLLDVFSMAKYHAFEEKQTWEICEAGGFWSSQPYLALLGCVKYAPSATVEQYSIITEGKIAKYFIWNTYFTPKSLQAEVNEAGFSVEALYEDVTGNIYHGESPTLALLLEKK